MPTDATGATRGVCRACGCTYEDACPGGCSWADASETICTRCAAPCAGCAELVPLGEWPGAAGERHVKIVDEHDDVDAVFHARCVATAAFRNALGTVVVPPPPEGLDPHLERARKLVGRLGAAFCRGEAQAACSTCQTAIRTVAAELREVAHGG